MDEVLDTLFATILERQASPRPGSYTAKLLDAGEDEILKKVGEEAMEVILAAKGQGDERLVSEVADLFYHLLVLLAARGLTLADVEAELMRRRAKPSKREVLCSGRRDMIITCDPSNREEQAKMSIKRAILSVYDKTGLVDFARPLAERGVDLVASGGTARTLKQTGLPVQEVSDLTGSPEILGGRVKTLHPAVHGGVLSRRTPDDRDQLDSLGWGEIDLVVVNLYPFEKTVADPNASLAEIIEQIDIGGVALLRAAAKNFAHVTAVCDPTDYAPILEKIEAQGEVSLETRRRLAVKAFTRTAAYDAAIRDYLAGDEEVP
ncbi:MAG: phosphoribosyl-ATP diphosphatase [Anaerolineae bacterium]